MSTDNDNTIHYSEAERFNCIAECLDGFSALIEGFNDENKKNKAKEYLAEIENLVLASPEWIYNDNLPGINMGFFGGNNSGWIEVLTSFINNERHLICEGMGFRVKHVIKVRDQSKHLLLIRRENDLMPNFEFSNWVDCALFVFRLNDEKTYRDAFLGQKELLLLRNKDSKHAPTILVGCLDGVTPENPRLRPFLELKYNAQQFGFDDYIEVRCEDHYNTFFLFEYCTLFTQKCKHGPMFICDELAAAETRNHINAKKRKSHKRKTCFDDEFKAPIAVPTLKKSAKNAKRTNSINEAANNDNERRQSFTIFNMRNKSLPRTNLEELGSSFSSTSSLSDQVYAKLNRRYVSMIQLSNQKPRWRFFHRKKGNSSKDVALHSVNIVIQGTLYKGRNKKWVTITEDANMFYHNSKQDFEKGARPKSIDLQHASVKVPGNSSKNGYYSTGSKGGKKKASEEEDKHTIKINIHNGKGEIETRVYRACSEEDRDLWMDKIKNAIFHHYSQQKINDKYQTKTIGDSLENVLIKIRKQLGNDVCAECNTPNPNWVAYNLGILICDRCSGAHRNLGVEVSRVCSLELDGMDKTKIKILEAFGNVLVNSVMEAKLKLTDDVKPNPNSVSVDDWLVNKYKLRKYVAPLPFTREDVPKQLMFAIQEYDRRYQLICMMNSTKDQLNSPYDECDKRNALMIAASIADIVAVQLLLWAGVNTSFANEEGINAIGCTMIIANGPDTQEVFDLLKRFNTPIQKFSQKLP